MSRRFEPRRALRHLWASPLQVRRALPPAALARIEAAIAEGERQHRAELRFAVEAALDLRALWMGLSPRGRAHQLFSRYRIWDTEHNNGVLIYLLWADRAVEIVADRGAAKKIDPAVWRGACDRIVAHRREGRTVEGVLEAIAQLNQALAVAYPVDPTQPNPDELSNRPVLL